MPQPSGEMRRFCHKDVSEGFQIYASCLQIPTYLLGICQTGYYALWFD